MKKFCLILISLLIAGSVLVGCESEQQKQIPIDRLSHQTQTENETKNQTQETQLEIENDSPMQETVSLDDTLSESINFLGWVDYDTKFEGMNSEIKDVSALNLPAKNPNESINNFTSEKEAVEFVNSKIMPNDMFNLEYTTIDGIASVVFSVNVGGGTGKASHEATENNENVVFVVEYKSDYYMNSSDFYYDKSTQTLYIQMKEDHRAVKSMDLINNAPGGLLYVVLEDSNIDIKNVALIKPDPANKEF